MDASKCVLQSDDDGCMLSECEIRARIVRYFGAYSVGFHDYRYEHINMFTLYNAFIEQVSRHV